MGYFDEYVLGLVHIAFSGLLWVFLGIMLR